MGGSRTSVVVINFEYLYLLGAATDFAGGSHVSTRFSIYKLAKWWTGVSGLKLNKSFKNLQILVLTPNQNKCLCLLAAGYSRKEAAAQTGVSISSVNKWAIDPNFQKLLRDAVAKTYDAAVAELVSGSQKAAQELKAIIADPDTPKRVKVSAIQVLLTTAAKAKEAALEERLEAIEDVLNGDVNS